MIEEVRIILPDAVSGMTFKTSREPYLGATGSGFFWWMRDERSWFKVVSGSGTSEEMASTRSSSGVGVGCGGIAAFVSWDLGKKRLHGGV
jgi:hypothetical protein